MVSTWNLKIQAHVTYGPRLWGVSSSPIRKPRGKNSSVNERKVGKRMDEGGRGDWAMVIRKGLEIAMSPVGAKPRRGWAKLGVLASRVPPTSPRASAPALHGGGVASPGALWVLWALQGGTARRYINRIIWGCR
jgi:hypothetical protein